MIENDEFLKKIMDIERDYDDITEQLGLVEVMQDNSLYQHLCCRQKDLADISLKAKEIKKLKEDLRACEELLGDGHIENLNERQQLLEGFETIKSQIEQKVSEAKILLSSKLNNESKVVVFEIFAKSEINDYVKLYAKLISDYAEKLGSSSEISFEQNKNICVKFSTNKFKNFYCFSGKIKIIDERAEELSSIILTFDKVNDEISDSDIEYQTLKSSGAGGQHINKTESAVRAKHIPTGLTVVCENQRSQVQNKQMAKELLIRKVKQNFEKKRKNDTEFQKKRQKNAVFGNNFNLVFDFKNQILKDNLSKKTYILGQDMLSAIEKLIGDRAANGQCD